MKVQKGKGAGQTPTQMRNQKVSERQDIKMNAEMKMDRKEFIIEGNQAVNKMKNCTNKMDEMKELGLVSEDCNCSVYSMVTVGVGVLLAIGTVIYSLIAM